MASLSSPTLQTLLSKVRVLLNQPDRNNSFWQDDELTGYINDAIAVYFIEVTNHAEGLFTAAANLDITASSETIALPTDFFELRAVYKKDGSAYIPLPYRPRNDEAYSTLGGMQANTFRPSVFLRGNSLVLRPIPEFTETAGIRIEYLQFPETLVNGGDVLTSQVSPIFRQLIEMFAVYKAKLRESLVNGNGVHKNAEEALGALYAQFKEKIAKRSQQTTFIKPYNPESEE